ncbi:Piwi-domain-containing protein [Dentipellis sp. KUC8613]|nr:Piwi-domain-containing protein [Dentipellis sp. KUC8613]
MAFPDPAPVSVQTNAFVIKALPSQKSRLFYHYDTFDPEIRQPFRAQIYLDHLQTIQEASLFRPRVVFDGKKNVWSSHKLFGDGGATFDVRLSNNPNSRSKPVTIRFTPVGAPIDVLSIINAATKGQPISRRAEAVNILQAIVRQAPIMRQKTFNARSVFSSEGARVTGGAFDLWRGYFQSVRPAPGRMIINVDISTGIVYAEKRLDAWASAFLNPGQRQVNIRELSSLRPGEEKFKNLKNVLKGVRIKTDTPKQSQGARPIKSIIPQGGRYEFDLDGKMTTVAEYYAKRYGKHLQYPDSFGVVMKEKPFRVVIPAEICFIEPGQLFKKKVPPHLMDEVLRFSSQPPAGRLSSIQRGIGGNFLSYSQSDFLSAANVTIDTTPINVKGKMLPPPSIQYGDTNVSPRAGSWNLVGRKFIEPGAFNDYVIVNFSALPAGVVLNFVRNLAMCCADLATSKPKNQEPIVLTAHGLQKVWGEIAQYKPKLVLAILPTNAAELRRALKAWGETGVGIPTQCVRENKVHNAGDQYNRNLAMKINTKLLGTNSAVQHPLNQTGFMAQPLMVVGADVGHAGAGINNQPSIASVVASFDRGFSKYMTSVSLQEPRTEIIADLSRMMFEAMKFFYLKNKPMYKFRIVFFRDGVSEGEYDQVLQYEVSAIQEAWAQFIKPFKEDLPLKLTYIVVGKRHHIRFFPPDRTPPAVVDRSNNFTAGLVVDQGVIDPSISKNFYLQSHGGLKGR